MPVAEFTKNSGGILAVARILNEFGYGLGPFLYSRRSAKNIPA
jgi:hypothetical protein